MVKPRIHTGHPLMCTLLIYGMLGLGCAGIIEGTQHDLSIESNPQTAHVTITSGGKVVSTGRTPFVTQLSKKNEYTVNISIEGCEEAELHVTHQGVQGSYWLNFFSPFYLGFIIDYSNGAIYKMGPSDINVSLKRASVPETAAEEQSAVIRECG